MARTVDVLYARDDAQQGASLERQMSNEPSDDVFDETMTVARNAANAGKNGLAITALIDAVGCLARDMRRLSERQPTTNAEGLVERLTVAYLRASGDDARDGTRAILSELASMPCEIPDAGEMTDLFFAPGTESESNAAAMVRLHKELTARLGPVLAAKDARIAELETAAAEAIATYFDPLAVTREGFDKLEALLPKGTIDGAKLQNARVQQLEDMRQRIQLLEKSAAELEKRLAEQTNKADAARLDLVNGKPFKDHLHGMVGDRAGTFTTGELLGALQDKLTEQSTRESELHVMLAAHGLPTEPKALARELAQRNAPVDATGKTPGEVGYDEYWSEKPDRVPYKDAPLEWTSKWERVCGTILRAFGGAEALRRVRERVMALETGEAFPGEHVVRRDDVLCAVDELAKLGGQTDATPLCTECRGSGQSLPNYTCGKCGGDGVAR